MRREEGVGLRDGTETGTQFVDCLIGYWLRPRCAPSSQLCALILLLLRDFVAAMVWSLMFTRQLKIGRSLEFCIPLWLWLLSRMLFQFLPAFF